jgi:TonB-linked SusC/RagA family outer membrane protein
MKKLTLFLLSFLITGLQLLQAQGVQITGKVTSAETGQPLPGVSIVVKGTTVGTTSGFDGTYKLTVPADAKSLMFSFVGLKTIEMSIEGKTTLDVQLAEEAKALSEIVVTGYTTQSKKSLTGAVSTISSEALANQTESNAIERIQGKASGVNIVNSHTPGGDATITIRGMGTINDNNPLYVIDGVPTGYGISQLNPNEIENISILKDASSAAIYGARGANGVIIITTKRGTSGKTKISFTARFGSSQATNQYKLLNTQEFGELTWLEAKNEGKPVSAYPASKLYGTGATPIIPDFINPPGAKVGDPGTTAADYVADPANFGPVTMANKTGTNWYDEIYQKAPVQEYNLSLTGGSEKGTYAFTVGYMNEAGILKFTGFDRYSIRSNSDAKPTDWLTVGESLGFSFTHGKGDRGDNGEGSPISQAYRMQPIVPVYDIMGNFAGTKGNGTGNGENAYAQLWRARYNFDNDLRGIGNGYADAKIFKDLHFKSLFGFDYRSYNGRNIFMKNPEFTEAKLTDQLTLNNNYTIQWNWANTLIYSKTLAESHKINVLVGTESIDSKYQYENSFRSTFFSTDPLYMQMDAGEADKNNGGGGNETKYMSYFGRANYDFKGKYLAELTFRRDGSSVFGANDRYGNFPAFSLGWRISEESFMAGTRGWLDNLKLRGGWGTSGNDRIGAYNGFTTFSTSSQFSYYGITGNVTGTSAGFSHYGLGNPDAKWETTKTTNVGFDIGLLNNALTASLDIWQRKTTGMLYPVPIPATVGSYVAPSVNIGDMTNTGFDISVNYKNKVGDLGFDIGLTISHYKNKIVKLTNDTSTVIDDGGLRQMTYTRFQNGSQYPEFYGLIVDGFFQTQAEADAYPKEFGGTYNIAGHFKFRDVNGDGVIDSKDRAYIGSPHPKFTAGLNINLTWKNLSLSSFFYSSYGNKLVNYVSRWIDYTQFNGDRSHDRLYKSWGSPHLASNADATLPLADWDPISQSPSTAFLEDGSFLRLKNLQIGFTLPKSISQKLGMERTEIYVQGTNLFTITKYKGLDPEVSSSGGYMGIDQGAWPTSRQMMFGVKLDL